MRTPITYYGGKQKMAKDIIARLYQKRTLYCEPFFGGGAVFFAKPKERVEVINDKKDNVINFYKVLQSDFDALNKKVQCSVFSESLFNKSKEIHDNPTEYDNITRAWAFWYLCRCSFSNNMKYFCYVASKGKERSASHTTVLQNRKNEFWLLEDRIQNVQIMDRDAIKCIKTFDSENAFFYIDPPYVGANQSYYAGYTQKDFDDLLECLDTLKGKFLLSSYDNENLAKYTKKNGWYTIHIRNLNNTTAHKVGQKKKYKIEVLTSNYDTEKQEDKE